MPLYSEDLIEEVRARNPIADVIGSYVHLTKKGSNYFGLCPFHNEKSPSFSVSSSKQMYYCFGCGKGGNVLTFVMEYENLSFQEAVEKLADRAGIELPKQEYTKEKRAEEDLRSVILKMHKDAAIFYCHILKTPEGKLGLDYLKRRGLTDESIRSFGLGYTGQHSGALYRYLKQKGYTDAQMKESGLITFREKGAGDKFWNRVMFPIMDINNRVIGFGGRVMGDGEPKYLNSPETKIFDKSRNLYGLNAARRTRENFLLVCEGYMDVISMHQYGFTNAVASLGTAFTSQHGMILKRYTDEVILCYDNDGAGRKAILRAIPILKEAGLKIRVLDLSPYKDPDEFMKNLGAEEFRKRIQRAVNAFLFEVSCMKADYDFSDPEDKANFFNACAKKLSGFSDEIERNTYTEAVAKTYGIDYGLLKSKVTVFGNQEGIIQKKEESFPKKSGIRSGKTKDSGIREAQKLILTSLIEEPEWFAEVSQVLKPEDFSDDLMKQAAGFLYLQLAKGKDALNPAGILDHFIDSEQYSEVSSLFSSGFSENMDRDEKIRALQEAVIFTKDQSLQKQIDSTADVNTLMDLLKEKQDLKNRRIALL